MNDYITFCPFSHLSQTLVYRQIRQIILVFWACTAAEPKSEILTLICLAVCLFAYKTLEFLLTLILTLDVFF